MAGSVNKVILVGNLGKDPEIRTFQSGGRIASFSIATSESWKDKASGERKEKTQWHNVVVKSDGLVDICERYLKKGAKVFIEGQLETRKYEKDGRDVYVTEVVLHPYRGELTMLATRSGRNSQDEADDYPGGGYDGTKQNAAPVKNDMDDEIPF